MDFTNDHEQCRPFIHNHRRQMAGTADDADDECCFTRLVLHNWLSNTISFR